MSLDGTDNTVLALFQGEGFASNIDEASNVRVIQSGESGLEFLKGYIDN